MTPFKIAKIVFWTNTKLSYNCNNPYPTEHKGDSGKRHVWRHNNMPIMEGWEKKWERKPFKRLMDNRLFYDVTYDTFRSPKNRILNTVDKITAILINIKHPSTREVGDIGYYSSPQSFIITFSYSLASQLWVLLISWFIVSVSKHF